MKTLYLILFKDGCFQTSVQKPEYTDYAKGTRIYKVTKQLRLEKLSEWYGMCLNELDRPIELEEIK